MNDKRQDFINLLESNDLDFVEIKSESEYIDKHCGGRPSVYCDRFGKSRSNHYKRKPKERLVISWRGRKIQVVVESEIK